MAAELFRKRPARRVDARRVARIDLRELVSVGAPSALERERVEVEHHHAPAKRAVGRIELVRRFIEANLFDLADDHRRARGILGEERGGCRSRRLLRRRIGASAPGAAATLRRKCSGWTRAAAAGLPSRGCFIGVFPAAALRLRDARNLLEQLAGLGIVLANGVHPSDAVPEVDESFAVDRHAMPLRRIEGADHVAVLVDVDHRWRPDAAVGDGRAQLRFQLHISQVVGTVVDPDVVVLIHRQPGDAADLPFVRHRLGPVRIELVFRCCWRLCGERNVRRRKARARERHKYQSSTHGSLPHVNVGVRHRRRSVVPETGIVNDRSDDRQSSLECPLR